MTELPIVTRLLRTRTVPSGFAGIWNQTTLYNDILVNPDGRQAATLITELVNALGRVMESDAGLNGQRADLPTIRCSPLGQTRALILTPLRSTPPRKPREAS